MRAQTPKEIGALIRNARLESGITQSELAAKIGASRYWVAGIERGNAGVELGLVLKALRAMGLTFTIEDSSKQPHAKTSKQQPTVQLSSLLERTIGPGEIRFDWPGFNPSQRGVLDTEALTTVVKPYAKPPNKRKPNK